MVYIIFVNPAILGLAGMPKEAVFAGNGYRDGRRNACHGPFANIPYALAPGMGLNAFSRSLCFALGFKWQEALAIVFICGIINIIITVTRLRKTIKIHPKSLQYAIGGGIGMFIAYIGVKNAGFLKFTSDPGKNTVLPDGTVIADSSIVPALVNFAGGRHFGAYRACHHCPASRFKVRAPS